MSVHLYVEGKKSSECRKAFRLFLGKLVGERAHLKIEACGSRDEAYKDFCRAFKTDPDTCAILLVDSEDSVTPGNGPCAHLRGRDRWDKPMPEKQVHLMVQCMEAWFLADRAAFAAYYGKEFNAGALPGNPNVEEIPKRDVLQGIRQATQGAYHKTRHGFEILELLDPDKVRAGSQHARTFFDFLQSQLT